MSSVNTGKKSHSSLSSRYNYEGMLFFFCPPQLYFLRSYTCFMLFFPKAKSVYRPYIRHFWLHWGFFCTLHQLKHRTSQLISRLVVLTLVRCGTFRTFPRWPSYFGCFFPSAATRGACTLPVTRLGLLFKFTRFCLCFVKGSHFHFV